MPATYTLVRDDGVDGIRCLFCHAVSYHPEDIRQRFCGRCDIFHTDDVLAWYQGVAEEVDLLVRGASTLIAVSLGVDSRRLLQRCIQVMYEESRRTELAQVERRRHA